MSLAQQVAPRPTTTKKTQPETDTIASGVQNQQQQRFGNDFLAREAVKQAVQEVSADDGTLDTQRTLGEDPGKYQFPEGPDGQQTGTGERKQQDEALPKLREKHADKTYSDVSDGAAFVQGANDKAAVDPNDVAQGALGDCYLMAAMAAVARAAPDAIQKIIKDKGDGTFEVTLYIRKNSWSKPTAVTKVVDARLPMNGSSALYAGFGDKEGGKKEMWPALIEKTLAQHKGSYDTIQGGQIADGFQFHGATELLTGKTEGYQATEKMAEDDILLALAAALEAKKPVTVDSRDMANDEAMSKEANTVNVYGNHAYAVESVDIDGRTVTLQNPWGSHHVAKLPVDKFKKYYRGIRIGG